MFSKFTVPIVLFPMVQSQFSLIIETVHHFAIVLGIEDPIYGEWTESLALYSEL
jgi:hypothetical protein